MAKRNKKTPAESLSSERPDAAQTPKTEIDFETLLAAAIAAAVIRPSKKRRGSKPKS
jgi:hypothetical protein